MEVNLKKSRKKRRRNTFLFMLAVLILLLALTYFLFLRPFLIRWLPSSTMKDLNEWFEVSGDEVRIYLDLEANMEVKAFVQDGEVYLPFDFVFDNINSRFYFNQAEGLLTYTLPDEVIDMDENSLDEDGDPLLSYRDNELYISTTLMTRYSNINVDEFVSDDIQAKRIFLAHGGLATDQGLAVRRTRVRENADKKAEILTTLERDDNFLVTEGSNGWSRIVTEDGFIGYVDNDYITMLSERYTYPDTYTEPVVTHNLLDEKVVMGFQVINSQEANNYLGTLYQGTGGSINVVAPMWLQISDANGTLVDYSSAAYIQQAHDLGLEVWPVVDNVNQPGGISDFDSGEFFEDTTKRRGFIDNLVNLAVQYGYDGLNIDLESIDPEAGDEFTQFFRELSVECRKYQLTLSIDSHVPYSYNSHYNLPEQGVFADYSLIMCYDEHTGSDVGPVASSTFTEFGITESLKSVPAEQLLICLPLYTRVWNVEADGSVNSSALGMQQATQYVSQNGISLSWDSESGSNYGEVYRDDGSRTQIWMEDADSLGLKMSYIEDYDVGGLGVWRLGFEPQSIWDVLNLNAGIETAGEEGTGGAADEIGTGSE